MNRICIEQLSKAFGKKEILKDICADFSKGSISCIMGESGVGKTTLLRILAGIEQPDSGTISGVGNVGMVFQENRLFENMTALDNVKIVVPKNRQGQVREELERLLPQDAIDKKVSQLSGGMKRRVAVVRAVLSPCDTLLLDEPFTGLDMHNIQVTSAYLLEKKENRTIFMTLHQKEIAQNMHADIYLLTSGNALVKIQEVTKNQEI